ncbi:winged helix-turn-helix domain-containing protein [Nocardia sp. 348MFTsu5.1]|uniref:winged helix-turn-helix domain-containing protein n=1 Tax=Nocardia sp. 348MFTsu5.1 TaxID=1172185 RepID=UPI00036726DF|nr:crosslink repair DNA glycosylase YcaQ family protein [Nocardia sp. 348MFTsu5.1]
MPGRDQLSGAQARRIALAAQGFTDRIPAGAVNRKHLSRVLERTRLLQMDSVTVAVRAHYMPIFSRLGAYDRAILEQAAWEPGPRRPTLLAEYWAHEAALVPIEHWPLFRWRMEDFRHGRWREAVGDRKVTAMRAVIRDTVAEIGPSTSGMIEDHLGHEKRPKKGTWWDRSQVKYLCEVMFAAGELSATRRNGFTRYYDLTENVLGEYASVEIERDDAIRELVRGSVTALGVGTEADIRDYYRLKPQPARDALAELISAGAIEQVQVQGWSKPAYLDPAARIPRAVTRTALLSPFDPLIFFRPRTERVFDFHYRIEIYVPEAKRVHGYYVLPYLMGDQLVARVDLKIDRATDRLLVPGAFCEPGADPSVVAQSLAADLHAMAVWLGVARVEVGDRGDLAPVLARAIGSSAFR